MELFYDILVVTTPAVMVLLIGYFLMKKEVLDLPPPVIQASSGPVHRPQVNFQAYERLVLYLERINPGNLALRMHRPGIKAKMLEGEMVKSIRDEFEHNLSQQIYVSDEIWKLIKQAKEETIKLIGLASRKCDAEASGTDLSQILLEIASTVEEFPHDVAIRYLKKELREKN